MAIENPQRSDGVSTAIRGLARDGAAPPPTAGMPFKDILRLARLEQGLSFHHLAERSQVDVAYLHRLEDGQASRPGRNVTIRISIGLGLDLKETEELLLAARHLPLVPETRSGRFGA